MGTIIHDAIIVTGSPELVNDARCKILHATEDVSRNAEHFHNFITEVRVTLTNDYATFCILPDGSKEWWDWSDACDAARQKAIEILRESYVDFVHVRYGELEQPIIATHDQDYEPTP